MDKVDFREKHRKFLIDRRNTVSLMPPLQRAHIEDSATTIMITIPNTIIFRDESPFDFVVLGGVY
jgi:hypothetical protein